LQWRGHQIPPADKFQLMSHLSTDLYHRLVEVYNRHCVYCHSLGWWRSSDYHPSSTGLSRRDVTDGGDHPIATILNRLKPPERGRSENLFATPSNARKD